MRIPFSAAIEDPLLFKTEFAKLSIPQGMILKAIYGADLTVDERAYWNAFHGYGDYDELGHLIGVTGEFPYIPQEYEDVTLVIGRRGAKTSGCSAFILAYEGLCGGHKEYVGAKQDPIVLQVAQDLETARKNLRQFVMQWLESSPIGKKELGNTKHTVTADCIRLKSALIEVGPPSIKLRSQGIAVCNLDELAFVAKAKDSAVPDFEIERAVRPAMSQFPFRKIIKTSTPWTKEGLLWDAANTGTHGHLLPTGVDRSAYTKTLVLRAPTAAMMNPRVPRAYLAQERAKDAIAFRREYLAEFADSVTGFLSPDLLRAAVTPGLRARAPQPGTLYVATLDPAFRRDAFAFCIGHLENDQFVLDYTHAWRGTSDQPLSPTVAARAISGICKQYNVRLCYSDQYHQESLAELAEQVGLSIIPAPLTNKLKKQMWGDVESYLLQGKLALLDNDTLLRELAQMEKRLTPNGQVQFGGAHDDSATVVALCLNKCLELRGVRPAAQAAAEVPLSTQIMDRIHRRYTAEQNGTFEETYT